MEAFYIRPNTWIIMEMSLNQRMKDDGNGKCGISKLRITFGHQRWNGFVNGTERKRFYYEFIDFLPLPGTRNIYTYVYIAIP
jgi:hypothetical protein